MDIWIPYLTNKSTILQCCFCVTTVFLWLQLCFEEILAQWTTLYTTIQWASTVAISQPRARGAEMLQGCMEQNNALHACSSCRSALKSHKTVQKKRNHGHMYHFSLYTSLKRGSTSSSDTTHPRLFFWFYCMFLANGQQSLKLTGIVCGNWCKMPKHHKCNGFSLAVAHILNYMLPLHVVTFANRAKMTIFNENSQTFSLRALTPR